jgi:thiol-disulfide isomerase/thioredoxin
LSNAPRNCFGQYSILMVKICTMNCRKIISFIIVIFFVTQTNAQREIANIMDPRLQIKLPNVQGDSITLASLKGKVILLDFWASWCGPCRSSNKKLVKLYEKYKSQGFEIFGVSLDEQKKDWEKAIAKDKITWLQVIDPRGSWNARTAADWNISVLPTSFLINKKGEGEVVAMDLEGKELEKGIADLLRE